MVFFFFSGLDPPRCWQGTKSDYAFTGSVRRHCAELFVLAVCDLKSAAVAKPTITDAVYKVSIAPYGWYNPQGQKGGFPTKHDWKSTIETWVG